MRQMFNMGIKGLAFIVALSSVGQPQAQDVSQYHIPLQYCTDHKFDGVWAQRQIYTDCCIYQISSNGEQLTKYVPDIEGLHASGILFKFINDRAGFRLEKSRVVDKRTNAHPSNANYHPQESLVPDGAQIGLAKQLFVLYRSLLGVSK